MVPLQRSIKLHIPRHSWMQTSSRFEDMYNEQGIPIVIIWSHVGKEVVVEGLWDSWKTRFLEVPNFFCIIYIELHQVLPNCLIIVSGYDTLASIWKRLHYYKSIAI